MEEKDDLERGRQIANKILSNTIKKYFTEVVKYLLINDKEINSDNSLTLATIESKLNNSSLKEDIDQFTKILSLKQMFVF